MKIKGEVHKIGLLGVQLMYIKNKFPEKKTKKQEKTTSTVNL